MLEGRSATRGPLNRGGPLDRLEKMMTSQAYTYRNGKKVVLEKSPNEFIVRVPPEVARSEGFENPEAMSPTSTRVTAARGDLEAAMHRARGVAPAHHAYYQADSGDEFLVTDRIFVTFKSPPSAEDLDTFCARYKLTMLDQLDPRTVLFQLTDATGMNPVKLVVKLTEEEDAVEVVDHDLNHRMTTYQLALPTDPRYATQWHLHTRFSHADYDARASARCEEAWQVLGSFGDPEVVVGVTDDGCRLDHQDFDSPGKFAGWGYFEQLRLVRQNDVDAQAERMYTQGANHGTSCAGVIAGQVDARLTVGAAPRCRLLPIKWPSSGPSLFIGDTRMIRALDYLADRVDIVSNSWGGRPITSWPSFVVNRIRQLSETGGRRGRGILFLWAAGNENCPIHHTANQDVPFTDGWQQLTSGQFVWVGPQTARVFQNNLADLPGVLHVGALASNARRSHYSNYGTGLDLCAPSSNSHAYFRMTVRGLGVTTTSGTTPTTVTSSFGGTSSATPLVAGIAALTISANPFLSAHEVGAILKETASKALNSTGYPRTPAAGFDPDPVWDVSPVAPFDDAAFQGGHLHGSWSPWFGYGRVDAFEAVGEAIRRREQRPGDLIAATSSPGIVIPDNRRQGVEDTIRLDDEATVVRVAVQVDISHTFIGDLRVTLVSPAGTEVVLHDRTGASANDIKRGFDVTSTPVLAQLSGESVAGDWVLLVQDLARLDVGRLNTWGLEIQGARTGVLVAADPGAARLGVNRTGCHNRRLSVGEAAVVSDIEVAVDIACKPGMQLALVSPRGTTVSLPAKGGAHSERVYGVYSSATVPELSTFRGEAAEGDWTLRVVLPNGEKAKINRWGLRIARA